MVNKVSGANFEIFCKNYSVKKQQIHDNCMSQVGKKSTDEILKEHKIKNEELMQESYDVLPDEWRVLANKKDKTPEDFAKMDKMYKDAFKELGKSYVNHADSTYGNNDHKLSLKEFLKSEDANENPTETTNEFGILDLNGDSFVDEKEMAALLCIFDMDVDNGDMNGRIKYRDIFVNQMHLVENPNSKTGKQMINLLKDAYNFLFGN